MKVTTYVINEGTNSQEVILINVNEGTVLQKAPNDWKTEKAAIRWAINHGFIPVQEDLQEAKPETDPDAVIAELKARIAVLEEKLRKHEDAWAAFRSLLKQEE